MYKILNTEIFANDKNEQLNGENDQKDSRYPAFSLHEHESIKLPTTSDS